MARLPSPGLTPPSLLFSSHSNQKQGFGLSDPLPLSISTVGRRRRRRRQCSHESSGEERE